MNIQRVQILTQPFEILTITQLMDITGRSRSRISNMINDKNPKLDVCFPFPINGRKKISGPIFIVRDDKCEEFIKRSKNGKKKR